MNKKGQGISMTYIIIAALALVVLVVIVLFFTGGMQALFQSQKEQAESASAQEKAIWRGQCDLYCSGEQKANFCQNEFTDKEGNKYKCTDLDGSITGAESLGVDCGSITTCK